MNKMDHSSKTKIKNAIENKLLSIGAYVDKELPEYIFVMIANKKNKESMEKDLNLFLGDDTSPFIEWLHNYLDKFQIEQETNKSKTKSNKQNIEIPDKKKRTEKLSEKEKPKEKADKSKLKSKRIDDKKERRHSTEKSSDHSKITPKKDKIHKEDKNKDDKHKFDKVHKSDKIIKEKVTKSDRSTKDISRLDRHETVKKVKQPIEEKPNLVMDEHRKHEENDIQKSTPMETTSAEHHVIDTKLAPTVAPMVSSVVKVTQRPIASRNNNDMFKGMVGLVRKDLREAEKTVISYDDICNLQMSPAKRQPQQDLNSGAIRSSVFDRLGGGGGASTTNSGDLRHSKLVRKASEENLKTASRPIEDLRKAVKRSLPTRTDKDDDGNLEVEQDVRRSKVARTETNFIVTMDGGVEKPKVMTRLGPKTSRVVRSVDKDLEEMDVPESVVDQPMNDEEDDQKQQQSSNDENRRLEVAVGAATPAAVSKCRFGNYCKNASCIYSHPTEPCKMFPSCAFGSSCNYLHPNCRFETQCSNSECAYNHSRQQQLQNAGSNVMGSKKQARCHFYPKCTKMNCPFYHPTTPCRFGYNCHNMETCKYLHPSVPARCDLSLINSAAITGSTSSVAAVNICSEVRAALQQEDEDELDLVNNNIESSATSHSMEMSTA